MTADASIIVGIKGQLGDAPVIKRNLDEIADKGNRVTGQMDRLDKKIQSTSKSALALGNAFKALIGYVGAREIIRAADQFTLLEARIKNSTRSVEEFTNTMRRLRELSAATGTSLESAVEVFQRISFVRDEIKATADEMVNFTGAVQKLGVVSGASTTNLNAGLRQLGQSLSSGIVRAEEFNSIMENIPAVGVAIAKQFGVTTGELRNLVINGEVLSKDVFAAILNQTEEINAQFENFPMTVGRAFNEFVLNAQSAVHEMDKLVNGTGTLAEGLRISGKLLEALVGLIKGYGNLVKAFFSLIIGEIISMFNSAAKMLEGTINLAIRGINLIKKEDIAPVKFSMDLSKKDISQAAFDMAGNEVKKSMQGFEDAAGAVGGIFNRSKEVKTTETAVSTREISKNYFEIAKNQTAAAEASEKLENSIDKTVESSKALNDEFQTFANTIESDLKDAFVGAFTGAGNGWKSLMEGFKSSFKNMIAQIAYQAIARPIIMPMIGAITGAGGFSGNAMAGGMGGGAGGLGGVGNVFSMGKSAMGLFSPGGGAVNAFGAKMGFGNLYTPGVGWSSGFTSASLGSVLGAAGLGFAGGGMLAGLIGGNQMGGSIGGGLGAAAGMMIGGPVGALIGGALGGGVGGLFGNNKAPRQTIEAIIGTNRQVARTGSKGASGSDANNFGNQVAAALSTYADAIAGEFLKGFSVGSNIGKTDTGTFFKASGTKVEKRVSGKAGDVNAAVLAALRAGIVGGGDPMMEGVLKRSIAGGGGLEQITSDLSFAKMIRDFEKMTEIANPLTEALDGLKTQFDELKKRAVDLGLPIDKLTESYERQRESLIEQTLKPLQDFLDSQALSGTSSLSPVQKLSFARSEFDKNLAAIKGGNYSGLNDLTSQAGALLDTGRNVFASSESFAHLETFVRQSVAGVAGNLGATGALNADVGQSIVISNAEQTSLLEQINMELQALREENQRLRKSMERIGNALVVS